MAENERHYCMALGPRPQQRSTRAAVVKNLKWMPGETIIVRFLDGDRELQDRVQAVAEEWTGPDMANLTLAVRRTTATPTSGSPSCRATAPGPTSARCAGRSRPAEPTMNYGWLTPDSADDELHRVVPHEFGHALGLIHEHQNPNRPISVEPGGGDRRPVRPAEQLGPGDDREQHVQALRPGERRQRPPPIRTSIMMYPIPAAWTTDGFSVGLNTKSRRRTAS